jgi:hypothetical protein
LPDVQRLPVYVNRQDSGVAGDRLIVGRIEVVGP